MIKKIKLIVSDRLYVDLSARGLDSQQIDQVLQWLSEQTVPVKDRADIEAELESIGFSPREASDIMVSLIKESVRPHVWIYFVCIFLGLLVLAIYFV